MLHGDEIVVTSETGFCAAYGKRPNFPQLKVRRCTDTDDHDLLAQAWRAELVVDNIIGPDGRQRPILSQVETELGL
jgi:hypothetical protein